jgi:hypothetical protein
VAVQIVQHGSILNSINKIKTKIAATDSSDVNGQWKLIVEFLCISNLNSSIILTATERYIPTEHTYSPNS